MFVILAERERGQRPALFGPFKLEFEQAAHEEAERLKTRWNLEHVAVHRLDQLSLVLPRVGGAR